MGNKKPELATWLNSHPETSGKKKIIIKSLAMDRYVSDVANLMFEIAAGKRTVEGNSFPGRPPDLEGGMARIEKALDQHDMLLELMDHSGKLKRRRERAMQALRAVG
jgi:hypothetical protein